MFFINIQSLHANMSLLMAKACFFFFNALLSLKGNFIVKEYFDAKNVLSARGKLHAELKRFIEEQKAESD